MFLTREKMEQQEVTLLAPYALLSKDSKGRFHVDHEPPYRTAFQRDRDRIIHAEAFRKLEYKTQVFVNDFGDYYRTRLTHTLEVAQIGRTIARALGVNEDLTEAICLAHDLGHPPFGHAGEDVLNKLMSDWGGFNHNHQSYRVVTDLERRYPKFTGLNLTIETLEGIAKHETEYDVSKVTNFDPSTRGSLEAQIADVSDELAYNAHDLDDGLQVGLITPDQLKELDIWQVLCDRLEWDGHTMSEIDRHRFIRELVGLMVSDVLKTTSERIAERGIQSVDDVIHQPDNLVTYTPTQKQQNRELKDFLYQNMYYHYRIVRMKNRADNFLGRLFETYVDRPAQLPPSFQARIDKQGVHRVVADYIASMTDRSALLEYRQIFDPMMRP
ncbi:MAG: deoxyguanosinetriphosphate triphosphohydrolase [Phototrophicaceae bacterium]